MVRSHFTKKNLGLSSSASYFVIITLSAFSLKASGIGFFAFTLHVLSNHDSTIEGFLVAKMRLINFDMPEIPIDAAE